MKKDLLLAVVLLFALIVPTFAGMNAGAVGAIHLEEHEPRSCSKGLPVIHRCTDIRTTYPGREVDFFPVFWDPVDGYIQCTVVEYDLVWDGQPFGFTSCSHFTVGSIRYPGDAIQHGYRGCPAFDFCIPGFGWLDSYDLIRMTYAYITDWNGEIDTVRVLYRAGTNGLVGDDPSGSSPTEPSTWGRIKAIFK